MPRDLAILACTECKRRNYTSTRNKRTMTERLEKVKYCPFDRKHTVHKEVKKKGSGSAREVAQWQCDGLQNR